MLTSPRRATRRCVSLFAVLGGSVVIAACGHSGRGTPTASPAVNPLPASATSASVAPAAEYDISGVDNVKNDFPPGFTTEAHPAKTLGQHDIDTSGVAAFTGAQVDPPQCRSLIIPPYAEPSAGTDAAGVRAHGDQGNIYVVALRLPQSVPSAPSPAGCDQVTMSGAPQASGTVEAIPGPAIAGVSTTGVKLSPSAEDDPDYIFTAALNDRTTVVVMGSAADELNPPQLMSDLLVKSVAAVKSGS